jgi:SdpI/YfhL protein family
MEDYMGTLILGVTAVLFIGLGLPLAYDKVRPNSMYGYRVSRYQLEDPEIWYAINRKGGRHLTCAGVILLLIAAVSALYIGSERTQRIFLLIALVAIFCFLAYEIVWSTREARRMAKDRGLF